jgi:hypothetical protein
MESGAHRSAARGIAALERLSTLQALTHLKTGKEEGLLEQGAEGS